MWLTNKIIDSYLKSKIKEIKKIDIKKEVLKLYEEHKEEVIKKAKEMLKKVIKDFIDKHTKKPKDKVQKQK